MICVVIELVLIVRYKCYIVVVREQKSWGTEEVCNMYNYKYAVLS